LHNKWGGFRESKEDELIRMDCVETQLDGLFEKMATYTIFKYSSGKRQQAQSQNIFYSKSTERSYLLHNEQTKCVLFAPEQIDIVTGSPDIRREYFNKLISTFDITYKKHLINYEQALRKRNKLLEHSHSLATLKEELSFWDIYLEKKLSILLKKEIYILNSLILTKN